MAGKLMGRDAIIDLVKSEHRANARRRREGLTRHPVVGFVCGCPSPSCGGGGTRSSRNGPSRPQPRRTRLSSPIKATRKASKRVRKANVARKRRKHAKPAARHRNRPRSFDFLCVAPQNCVAQRRSRTLPLHRTPPSGSVVQRTQPGRGW